MKKETALDFYIIGLVNILEDKVLNKITDEQNNKIAILEKQAKEMEKEQIVDAHYQGYRRAIGTTEVSEEYYNETYGGNK
jgi:hypothetical protein